MTGNNIIPLDGDWTALAVIIGRQETEGGRIRAENYLRKELREKRLRYRYRYTNEDRTRYDLLPDWFFHLARFNWKFSAAFHGDIQVMNIEVRLGRDEPATVAEALVTEPAGPKPVMLDTKTWIPDEVGRRRKADDIPRNITPFSRQLHAAMHKAKEAGIVEYAVDASTIRNRLRDWGLWPVKPQAGPGQG
jgi:hypothetical protein